MMRQSGLLWVGSIIILTVVSQAVASPQLPFICKVRKVDCARRPRSVCCKNYVAPVIDNKAEETLEVVEVGDEKDQETPDKLIQIASNIHEIVVKPNGEPIKTVEPAVNNNITTVATTETTTKTAITTTTTTTTEQNIPPFCLKLKFNCKLFSFHKCCKYNLPSSASSLVKVTKEKVVTRPPVEVSTEQSEEREETQAVEEETNSSILIKKNKSSLTNDKKKSLDKKIVKESKIVPVVEKKAKDSSPSSFKYSNQNKSKFFTSRKKNSGSSLFAAKRKRTGLCKIINCSRSKNHYCCKQELTTTTETTETTVTTVTPTTTQHKEELEEEQEEDVPVTERRLELTTTTSPTTTTTMPPYGDVTEGETTTESIQLEEAEATVISGSGDDEESDGAEVSSIQEDTSTSTMMSYPDYTHSEEDEMTTGSASTLENQTEEPSEEFEEVTRVSKQKSESYEETRIWYDGINEAGEFVEKEEPEETWSYKDYNGERVLQVYPVYIPAKTYPQYNDVDNEVLSNSIDDQPQPQPDIRNEITCEHVDCLAWPSNKCCSPHVTKKRHSIEEGNDKITATIVRIVKSVRWV